MIFTDQINHEITLSQAPKRIISLVPSQTELLFDLGLEERVVGITKFCVKPANWFKSKTRVGGTKNVNFDKIQSLAPDLIIANKEENTQSEIEELQKQYTVWTSDVKSLDDSLNLISSLGVLCETTKKASSIISNIKSRFEKINRVSGDKTCLYLIWQKPFIAAGSKTFIHHMISMIGLINFEQVSRYPEVSENALSSDKLDYILLSSEPFPFKEKHRITIQNLYPQAKIVLVDGEMFSWFGSRLLHAPNYFNQLVNELSNST